MMTSIIVILISSTIATVFIKCSVYAIKVGVNIILELIKKY